MREKNNSKETKPRVEFTMFCSNCANETNHLKLFSHLYPNTIECFSKNSDGSVKDTFWSIHIFTYIFAECLGCETPSVSIDEYFPDSIDSIGIRAFAKEIEDKGKSEKYNILIMCQIL